MPPVDAKQIQLIHIAKGKLGLDDAVYREMLMRMFTVESSKALSYDQAGSLIDHMKKMGFRIKAKRKCSLCGPRPRRDKLPDNVVLLPSREQMLMIGHLKQDIIWKVHDGYNRWLMKYFGVTVIKDSITASRVIEALKGMWKSQNPCQVKCSRNEHSAKSIEQRVEGLKPHALSPLPPAGE